MSFLVVDNKRRDLDSSTEILKRVAPHVRVFSTPSAEEALELPSLSFDVAFIDIELEDGKMNGLELAARLKAIHKDTHVIFITSSRKYFQEAFSVHAAAYLLKTVSEEDIRRELNYISHYYPAPLRTSGKVYVQTFGGFSVFLDGKLIDFPRSKAKELLALLVDRRGLAVTAHEACAVLFGDKPYNKTSNGYYHVLVNSLSKTLEEAGIKNVLVRTKNHLAINPDSFECDAYLYMRQDPSAVRSYRGDYLNCYSWSEFSANAFNTSTEGANI